VKNSQRLHLLLVPLLLLVGACSARTPVLIAHRGNSSAAPENTLAAVRSALALEIAPDLCEIDVHRSADGALVVIHDDTLDRTAGVAGKVADLPLAQLRRHPVGFAARFGEQFAGEPLPILSEVLGLLEGTDTDLMIEIKVRGVGAEIARLLARRGELDRHLIASFDPGVVVDASMAVPRVRTLLLRGESDPEELELARRMGVDVLGVSERSLTPEAVQRAHEHGLELWVYTVNDTARATELLDWGVDGLITDRPAEMRALAPFAP
jgi:glycerophosphoryl diester phosphodiesterase